MVELVTIVFKKLDPWLYTKIELLYLLNLEKWYTNC